MCCRICRLARYHYVLGVALNSTGRPDEALDVLHDARARFPTDGEINWGLATMLRDAGRVDDARRIVREKLRDDPDNPNLNALMRSLGEQR